MIPELAASAMIVSGVALWIWKRERFVQRPDDYLEREAAAAMRAPNKRILLIDDEAVIRTAVGAWLEMQGFDVETADSGEHGLEKLRANGYGAVIVDQRMPGMSGEETIIRASVIAPHIPRLMFTAYEDIKAVKRAVNAGGASGVFGKTMDDREELVRKLSTVIGERRHKSHPGLHAVVAKP